MWGGAHFTLFALGPSLSFSSPCILLLDVVIYHKRLCYVIFPTLELFGVCEKGVKGEREKGGEGVVGSHKSFFFLCVWNTQLDFLSSCAGQMEEGKKRKGGEGRKGKEWKENRA